MSDLIGTYKEIKRGLEKYKQYKNNSTYDKLFLGFNMDDRFRAIDIDLTLESWKGVYGNSTVSNFLYIKDKEIFKKYFIAYLNDNTKKNSSRYC